jgi:NitT/TauT family transport system substrate-binding protein
VLSLALAGCAQPQASEPTALPIIVVATPLPFAPTQPATDVAPVATSPAQPTSAAEAAAPTTTSPAQPTSAAEAAAPTATAPAGKGTITFAFDSFPSYFPILIVEQRGLLKRRGYDLKLIPFAAPGTNDVPEAERYERLQRGEWDVLATTLNSFARHATPEVGAITAIVDESAGVDKIVARPEIKTLNDLKGRRISFSQGSVSEYLLYYGLSLAGLGPQDIAPVPQPSLDDAVKAFTDGQVEAVVGWTPRITTAEQQGGVTLIASDKLRAVIDVLVTARPALGNRTEAVQAFHEAWYEALQVMIDRPDVAEEALIAWGNNDWTGVAQQGDLAASLEGIAQATLNANQIVFQQSEVLANRIREAQNVWINAGQSPPPSESSQLIDGQFTLVAARDPGLFSTRPPVDSSFLLTSRVVLPQLSPAEQDVAQEVVKLPLEQIDFEADSSRIAEKARKDLSEQVLPVLRASRLYLRIDGSAAWPGPQGRFSAEEIRTFATERATSVATFLSLQGIDPNRLIIGALDSKYPNSINEDELAQDRIVRFTLIAIGGR